MRVKSAQLGYRASEVAKVARVLPSTVRYWAGQWGGRLIRPGVADPRVAGSRKLFSAANIVEVRVATMRTAYKLARQLLLELARGSQEAGH